MEFSRRDFFKLFGATTGGFLLPEGLHPKPVMAAPEPVSKFTNETFTIDKESQQLVGELNLEGNDEKYGFPIWNIEAEGSATTARWSYDGSVEITGYASGKRINYATTADHAFFIKDNRSPDNETLVPVIFIADTLLAARKKSPVLDSFLESKGLSEKALRGYAQKGQELRQAQDLINIDFKVFDQEEVERLREYYGAFIWAASKEMGAENLKPRKKNILVVKARDNGFYPPDRINLLELNKLPHELTHFFFGFFPNSGWTEGFAEHMRFLSEGKDTSQPYSWPAIDRYWSINRPEIRNKPFDNSMYDVLAEGARMASLYLPGLIAYMNKNVSPHLKLSFNEFATLAERFRPGAEKALEKFHVLYMKDEVD